MLGGSGVGVVVVVVGVVLVQLLVVTCDVAGELPCLTRACPSGDCARVIPTFWLSGVTLRLNPCICSGDLESQNFVDTTYNLLSLDILTVD